MTRPANASFWEWPWRRHGRVSSSESCVGSGAERVNRRCLRSFCWVLSRFFAIGAWGPAEALQGSCSCSWSRSVCPDSITSTMTREWVPGGGMTGYRPGDVSRLQAIGGSRDQTTCPGPLTSLRGKPLGEKVERVFCSVKRSTGICFPDVAPDFHVRLTLRHAWFDHRTKAETGIEASRRNGQGGLCRFATSASSCLVIRNGQSAPFYTRWLTCRQSPSIISMLLKANNRFRRLNPVGCLCLLPAVP